jgi:hypothetical protein
MREKQQTFVLLDEWVPNPTALSGDDALVELAFRYATGHGPATAQDFAWWAGLTLADARKGLDGAGSRLGREEVGGVTVWTRAEFQEARAEAAAGGYLLPGFDELLLGYRDRDALLPREHANRVVPGGNGVFFPMIVLDGRIAGTWKRIQRKGDVDVVLNPFVERDDLAEILAPAIERYRRFLGADQAPGRPESLTKSAPDSSRAT